MSIPRVVVVGAGFGGLEVARRLARKDVAVTLLDRNNYHLFTPLLYQVASSLLNPSDIAQPVRSILKGAPNVRFVQGEAVGIDFARTCVMVAGGQEFGYDSLVLAAGSVTNFFGVQSAEQRALGLKDLPESLELRNHVIRCLEQAALVPGSEAAARLLSFVVVGGGPTGVEYAGALSELIRLIMPREYPELAFDHVRISLVEALPNVLPPFPARLQQEARRALESRGPARRVR